jgi:hypothetical protein
MLFNSGDIGASAGGGGAPGGDNIHAELERLRARERQMLELLGSNCPERLLHDLRNVLNELQLLRLLADDKV